MITPTPEIRQCFDAALQSLLSNLGVPADQVAWENAKHKPDPKKLYLQPILMLSPTDPASLGTDGFERISGIYQVSVFAPRDIGPKLYETTARNLVDFFRGGTRLDCCGSQVTITTAYTGTAISESDRVMCPVSVAWYCYTQKG